MATEASTPFPLGVFTGNPNAPGSSAEATFDAGNETFESLMGTTPTFQNTYIDASQTPSEWASNASYFASVSETSATFAGSIPVIGLPMGSTNPDAPSTAQILENYADGAYDSMLQSMVKSWADDGFMTQYWRPGVEMNLSSTPGFVGSSASLQALWISAFQHIYTTLHAAASADGVDLKVIWNPGTTNDTAAGNATETLWPGAQYVDVIGADVYADVYPYGEGSSQGIYDWDKSGQELNSPNPVYDTSLQEWASDPVNLEHYYTDPASDQYSLDASGGSALSLQDLINFAKAQGKPIAICETGAGNTADGAGLSDNPTFVQWLSSTLTNSGVPVDFVSIWDSDGGGTYAFSSAADDKPLEAAAWAKYFGVQTTAVTSTPVVSSTSPHAASPADTQVNGTTGSIYDTSGNAWTINSGGQIEMNGTVVASSAEVVTLFWTGTALDQLNTSGDWWTQPLNGSAGTELTGAPAGYEAPTPAATPISITLTTEAVATTDTASIKPFNGAAIMDANSGQTETATVTLSASANGTLSDPNAATDGSKVVNGVLTISGSVTVVAAALDGLVFTPTANQVAPGSGSTTTVTAAIKDTAGKTASVTSTVTATDMASPITVTPKAESVATTDTASVKPFTSVTIADANAGQTETATVALSAAANGTLSDPNAATDGSKVVNGVITVSGSATTVATALDGLVFKPTENQVAAGAVATTTVTAAIKDSAGETASATSTIAATQVAAATAPPPAVDTLALQISEDAWKGDAEFTVSVDGKQVGGDYTAFALHSSGDAGTFLLTGDWGSGVNDVQVSFINDAYGGTPEMDRNLYVNSIAYNGVTYAGTTATMLGNSTDSFAVGGTAPTATGPADTLTLNLSEDAWEGNADFVLYIDGKAVSTEQAVTALHDQNATQSFTFTGNLGAGTHSIGVAFMNDAYGGTPSMDRNLYINGITMNGATVFSGVKPQYTDGTSLFTVTTTH